MGDLSARLGLEDVPFSYHDKTNRNGGFLKELMVECGLVAANTLFQKRKGKLWTHKNKGSGQKIGQNEREKVFQGIEKRRKLELFTLQKQGKE